MFASSRFATFQMLSEWIRVSEVGFGSYLALFSQAYARHGYGPDAFSFHSIGYADDTPVTSGTLLEAGGCATISDVSTPPAFRHPGFGGAIAGYHPSIIHKDAGPYFILRKEHPHECLAHPQPKRYFRLHR